MRKMASIILAGLLVTGLALSGQAQDDPSMPGPGPQRRGVNRGDVDGENEIQVAMIQRILRNQETIDELGLTAEQVAALKEGLFELQKEQIKVRADMELAALEQAELLTARELNEKALMKAVEKTGELRTAMAKLKIRELLLVKQTLTVEQIEAIKKLMRERAQQREERMNQMRGENGNRGERQMRGGDREERRQQWTRERHPRRDEIVNEAEKDAETPETQPNN